MDTEVLELHPQVWKSSGTALPEEQIASWQERGPLRQYPYRLPSGELIALYAESAKVVVDAVSAGALDRLH